jgi:hypothetical protein
VGGAARRFILATTAVLAAILAGALGASTASAAPTKVTAHGSAKQVYVTGLQPNAKASLVNSKGHTVQNGTADPQGGLLFRKVAPGHGYRVKLTGGPESGPVTVHSNADAPWDPSIYKQKISDCGYQYLTARDGIKLALTVSVFRPAPGSSGRIPDADRVRRLRICGPGRTNQRDRRSGQRDGIRSGRRQYARNRVLRGSV